MPLLGLDQSPADEPVASRQGASSAVPSSCSPLAWLDAPHVSPLAWLNKAYDDLLAAAVAQHNQPSSSHQHVATTLTPYWTGTEAPMSFLGPFLELPPELSSPEPAEFSPELLDPTGEQRNKKTRRKWTKIAPEDGFLNLRPRTNVGPAKQSTNKSSMERNVLHMSTPASMPDKSRNTSYLVTERPPAPPRPPLPEVGVDAGASSADGAGALQSGQGPGAWLSCTNKRDKVSTQEDVRNKFADRARPLQSTQFPDGPISPPPPPKKQLPTREDVGPNFADGAESLQSTQFADVPISPRPPPKKQLAFLSCSSGSPNLPYREDVMPNSADGAKLQSTKFPNAPILPPPPPMEQLASSSFSYGSRKVLTRADVKPNSADSAEALQSTTSPDAAVLPPPPPKQLPSLSSLSGSREIPTRAHAGQLLDASVYDEFICRICLALCDPADMTLLPCSHVFCRSCVRSYVGSVAARQKKESENPKAECPVCRGPFTSGEAGLDDDIPCPVEEWLLRVRVRCAFAPLDKLVDGSDDPLPTDHVTRAAGLCCDWEGNVGNFVSHLNEGCHVAEQLRRHDAKH